MNSNPAENLVPPPSTPARDLLTQPVWRGDELGLALPESPHAVSVALPRWQDVVGYEEKRPEVLDRLQSGYPRFVIHPLVRELARWIAGDDRPCLPLPSARSAEWCVKFISRLSGARATVIPHGQVHAVATTPDGDTALRAFWQHTGLIVSTRQAEAILGGCSHSPEAESAAVKRSLRRRLASFYHCAEDDVFLAPTGMAAQFAALQTVIARAPGRATVQLGFPYVDTLKLQEKFGAGATLLHNLARIPDDLCELVRSAPPAACFCELPGNPLLGSADVRRITPVLRAHRIPLVADDVVATPVNVDLGPYADLVATSLTKYFAGTCDVMGGALICNPRSPLYGELKAIVRSQHEDLLWPGDAAVLEQRLHSFPHRMHRHNLNGLLVAERLRVHPAVERVWYPKWEFSDAYEAVRRPSGGWGALVTFLPRAAEVTAPRIYDRLAVCKGPSLGTTFTLACPFTLLAHYTELDWAEACGVPRHLIRLSVGLEDPEELWGRLATALDDV
ncbi:MAG: PLP-dependent transferase [Verrucomicrobia bacterium]|nr:PLP-dependent transferase [Verrucomicrobiota bacterium]